ncbi:unnamed protein product [Protopolystoma xenopodis]|uniref:Uncharacterized protein n=1 Tax=Protopolystoma xenopodis TaxID=117903 RepID=A0A3S5ALT8_9PLAT|nr:unnamed protein product [Protopolystoma xenopodis]
MRECVMTTFFLQIVSLSVSRRCHSSANTSIVRCSRCRSRARKRASSAALHTSSSSAARYSGVSRRGLLEGAFANASVDDVGDVVWNVAACIEGDRRPWDKHEGGDTGDRSAGGLSERTS